LKTLTSRKARNSSRSLISKNYMHFRTQKTFMRFEGSFSSGLRISPSIWRSYPAIKLNDYKIRTLYINHHDPDFQKAFLDNNITMLFLFFGVRDDRLMSPKMFICPLFNSLKIVLHNIKTLNPLQQKLHHITIKLSTTISCELA
jgi:hypothetical protein